MFVNNTPENIQAIAITAPVPSYGQLIVSLDDRVVVFDKDSNELVFLLFSKCRSSALLLSFKKKLDTLSFEYGSESGSMSAIKNHIDLGLYNMFKKSKITKKI